MNIKSLFMMNTAADVYTWMYPIRNLLGEGHQVKIIARNYGCTLDVLRELGFSFRYFNIINSKYLKMFQIFTHVSEAMKVAKEFRPSIIIGFGVDAAITAALLRKPCIVFMDNEPTPFLQYLLMKPFVDTILTPDCFLKDLGKKHLRFNSYKEIAYLHPSRFSPDPLIYKELGLNQNEKFVILRFNGFDAMHDIGRKGFSILDKRRLIQSLRKYARLFISSEGNLPSDLLQYKLDINPSRIHHALYYASLVVADTGTIPWEAAVLGTPAVVCGSFMKNFGNFIELEQKYGLIYTFIDSDSAIEKSIEILNSMSPKSDWQEKRGKLLKEKIDASDFITNLIKSYS